MDLGLTGKRALICASSRGLGKACAVALAREGAAVVVNGRDPASLAAAVEEIARIAATPPVRRVANINTADGRERLIAACPDADILVTNNAGPPPGSLDDWDSATWFAAIEANMLAPIALISALAPGMRGRRFGRIINITSAVVKSPRLAMSLSTVARTGLTAFAKGLARECIADNVTINNLLPQHFDTDRQKYMAHRIMKDRGISFEDARALQVKAVRARRFGQPNELGDACAFLSSAQAGYITGQKIPMDGGSYDGLM